MVPVTRRLTNRFDTPDPRNPSTIRPHEPPPPPPASERWDAELERRRLILGIPPGWGEAEVEALVRPFVADGHDLDIHVGDVCPDARGAFVTLPGWASADGLRMAVDGLEVDGYRLAVRNAKPSRKRVLNHTPEAQAHRAANYQARERKRRRPEDARTAGLKARGLPYRAIAAALGRVLPWVQRSLRRFDRGYLVPTCSQLGHAPCGAAPDGVYREPSNAGRLNGASVGDRLSESKKDQDLREEGETRTRTAPDTRPPLPDGLVQISQVWREAMEGRA